MSKTKAPAKTASTSLSVKRTLRAKTPRFTRHANHRKVRLDDRWKKPRGLHNKQKDNKTASFPKPSSGYRTPVEVRGLHISGLAIVRVNSLADVANVKEGQGAVIGKTGMKKQLAILEACKAKGIRVLNHKVDNRITAINSKVKAHQEEVDKSRKEKEEAKKKKDTKKAPVEEKLTEEEKKEQEQKVKEEVLKQG